MSHARVIPGRDRVNEPMYCVVTELSYSQLSEALTGTILFEAGGTGTFARARAYAWAEGYNAALKAMGR